ncbi:MAG: carbamate kinase [Propioniciclava sp.]
MTDTALIAIGGNALVHEGEVGTLDRQHQRAADFAAVVAEVVSLGMKAVITHGNGPQVGYILRRGELVAGQSSGEGLPGLPLWLAVADSQGGIGHLLAVALDSALAGAGLPHRAATVLTHVEVDRADPAFAQPTKPIGPTLNAERADQLTREEGWAHGETSPGRWRRLVASPQPQSILEVDAVAALSADPTTIVIAAGGGGIPVASTADGWTPVDAVVDKDRTSALLAARLGIGTLVLVTGVDAVRIAFGTPQEQVLAEVSAEQMAHWLGEGHFPPGSMGPKVEAALNFLDAGGDCAVITSMENVVAALQGSAGTRITPTGRQPR